MTRANGILDELTLSVRLREVQTTLDSRRLMVHGNPYSGRPHPHVPPPPGIHAATAAMGWHDLHGGSPMACSFPTRVLAVHAVMGCVVVRLGPWPRT